MLSMFKDYCEYYEYTEDIEEDIENENKRLNKRA